MRKEGLPIVGLCVAAGVQVPTTEKAVEIMDGLKTAGIRHVAFKPKSVDGIRQVVVLVDIIPLRISTSQFWQPIVYRSILHYGSLEHFGVHALWWIFVC